MITLIGTMMLLVFCVLGAAVGFAPWIGLVLYLKQKKGTQVVEHYQPERGHKPPGPTMDGKDWLILIGTIVYLISPVDALPDVFFGLGWCDDLGLIAFAVRHFYNKFWSNKEPETPPEPPRRAVIHRHEDDDAIDAEFEMRNLPALRQNQLVEARRRA